jgi:hypothetical protein
VPAARGDANSQFTLQLDRRGDDRRPNLHRKSAHGAPNELARQLVAAGFADRPMVIRYQGLAGSMTYRSFHASATWTYSEGNQPLRRVRYREPPEGVFLGSGARQKCVSSPVVDECGDPADQWA